MKQLLSNWNFLRGFRLLMALVFAVQAYEIQSIFMALFSGILFYQVYTNMGCCGVPTNSKISSDSSAEVVYEEIK